MAEPRSNMALPGPGLRGDPDLRLLLEMAMKNSGEKMSAMLKVPILLESFAVDDGEDTEWASPVSGAPCRGVVLGIRGEVAGSLLLLMSQPAAAGLNAIAPEDYKLYLPDEAERERALLEELANLLASTYLDVFSDVCGLRLLPTPPAYLIGPGAALLAQFQRTATRGPEAATDPAGGVILRASVLMKNSGTVMFVASRLGLDACRLLTEGARRHMPELFLS